MRILGKNSGNKDRQPQMPQVQRPQIPPLRMAEDLDQRRETTQEFYDRRQAEDYDARPKAPLVLPMEDVATGIKDIVEQFGKRAIPSDIPKAYQDLLKQLRQGLQDMAHTFIETARAAEDLESDIVARCRSHEEYMKREATIAQKVREKYGAIAAEIKAEMAKETEGK